MATRAYVPRGAPPARRGAWGVLLGLVALVALAAMVLIVALWSGVSISADPVALARLELQPFAGTIARATATGPGGRAIPLAVHNGRLTPLVPVPAGELISVDVIVRRPSWLRWALGGPRTERLTVRAPTAQAARPLADRAVRLAGAGHLRRSGQLRRLRSARASRAPDAQRPAALRRAADHGAGRERRRSPRRRVPGRRSARRRPSSGSRPAPAARSCRARRPARSSRRPGRSG